MLLLLLLCGGIAGTTLSSGQVHHTHFVTFLLPNPARCSHVQTGRSLARDHVHSAPLQHHVRRRRRRQTARRCRLRTQRHVSSRKHSVHTRTDMPHVLGLRYDILYFSLLSFFSCEIPWERVPYLSALEVCARWGAIQIHVYLIFTLPYLQANAIIYRPYLTV